MGYMYIMLLMGWQNQFIKRANGLSASHLSTTHVIKLLISDRFYSNPINFVSCSYQLDDSCQELSPHLNFISKLGIFLQHTKNSLYDIQ